METVLVIGLDTVAGANIATCLSSRYRVVGLTSTTPVSIQGCETHTYLEDDVETAEHWLSLARPQWVVYCGVAANSAWSVDPGKFSANDPVVAVRNWVNAAELHSARFTHISSDAIFTGPWMFHEEDCQGVCESEQAEILRAIEREVSLCDNTLIIRTNVFGWNPATYGPGEIENLVQTLQAGTYSKLDCYRHATPLLATDLAAIIEHAYQERLTGIFHVAGGERISPVEFVQRLAATFGLTVPVLPRANVLNERTTGFANGETSLHTRKIRRALSISMPMLDDGLQRLFDQQHNGFLNRLNDAPVRQYEQEIAA
ncbi:sugar nucleotide-binding protein [Gimesia fumaroli]|uniref:RmlD substrate binding domain protein n=1 Tax=Gimesia fumaroli TaxID=2527976 RepID=A0A518IIS3_9PLAN|nr:sugar nucleotide-binding protein [Gimesia fumaroli]QDV52996.1 RmlD substrate binding domain protein [Gimesia fumaroli]